MKIWEDKLDKCEAWQNDDNSLSIKIICGKEIDMVTVSKNDFAKIAALMGYETKV